MKLYEKNHQLVDDVVPDMKLIEKGKKDIDINNPMKEYESPVNVYLGLLEHHSEVIEDRVMVEINQQMQVDVNKEELIKALRYDRGQYTLGYLKGYNKGYDDAKNTEAIPVEWLKEKARAHLSDSWTEVCEELLAEWRQENDSD